MEAVNVFSAAPGSYAIPAAAIIGMVMHLYQTEEDR